MNARQLDNHDSWNSIPYFARISIISLLSPIVRWKNHYHVQSVIFQQPQENEVHLMDQTWFSTSYVCSQCFMMWKQVSYMACDVYVEQ